MAKATFFRLRVGFMRKRLAITGILLALMLAAFGTVYALSYEGEDYCRDHPAWPNGTYLGQMHPYHVEFYRGFAERRGWDPCATWAADQQASAVHGLRRAGYQIVKIQEPIPFEQNCGDQTLVPVKWQTKQTRMGNWNLHVDFGIFPKGSPVSRRIPYTLRIYDGSMTELRPGLPYRGYFIVRGEYWYPVDALRTRLISPSHAQTMACVRLEIDVAELV